MNSFSDHLVVIRGGGDLGSGVIWRLRRAGFPVIVLELERPLTVRRTVSFSSAVPDGQIDIGGIHARRTGTSAEAVSLAATGIVPVLVDSEIPDVGPSIVVDARLAKEPLDTTKDQAPFVVGLGPGFTAGVDCHAVIETMRGHDLGRVIWDGSAAPDTGMPGTIGGESALRVLRAKVDGQLSWLGGIGEAVEEGQTIGMIDKEPVVALLSGTVRGQLLPGPVTTGLKIGDIDPRLDAGAIWTISDKALSVGGGVLEAVLVWIQDGQE